MRRGHCEDRPKRWRGVPELSASQFCSMPKVASIRLPEEKNSTRIDRIWNQNAHHRTRAWRGSVEGETVGPLGVAQRGGQGKRARDGWRVDHRYSSQK